jgi:hypothetical protein
MPSHSSQTMNLRLRMPFDHATQSSLSAGALLSKAARQLARCLPRSLRAPILLAATIVFFPVIVAFMVLASVREDVPVVRHLLGSSDALEAQESISISTFDELSTTH